MIFVTCISEPQILKQSVWLSEMRIDYPAHAAGQVSKFPSAFWVTWNTTNIDWGREQVSSVASSLRVSARRLVLPAEALLGSYLSICRCVCEGYACLKHGASAAAASGAPAPPTGPLLWVRHRWRIGGRDGELTQERLFNVQKNQTFKLAANWFEKKDKPTLLSWCFY